MTPLNFKHLRYFWMVAKAGSIARASEQLHLSPQSISGQLTTLEKALGADLFQRAGRGLELTEAGRRTLSYADEIFTLGNELQEMLRDPPSQRPLFFKVGVADVVPKSIAYRLIEPALHMDEPVRLICREGPLDSLLAELAVHRLDMVIADRAMPKSVNVLGYNHFLGESKLSVFAAPALVARMTGKFPACLEGAPFLLPSAEVAVHPRLLQWFDEQRVHPRIVGEFDDSALLEAFGQGGDGAFVAPSAIAKYICAQYRVKLIGSIDSVQEQLFVISTQRHLTHPAVTAVCQVAREEFFSSQAERLPR